MNDILLLAGRVFFVGLVTEAVVEGFIDSEPLAGIRTWLAGLCEFLDGMLACGKCTAFWVSGAVTLVLVPVGWASVVVWLAGWRFSSFIHEVYTLPWYVKRKVEEEREIASWDLVAREAIASQLTQKS